MPCDSGPGPDDGTDARDASELKGLLCTFCESVERQWPAAFWPVEVRAWWVAHVTADARRREQEAMDRVAHEAHLLAQRRRIDEELAALRKPR